MSDAEAVAVRTVGLGRSLVCEARSPDGAWRVEVFGPSQRCNYLYADASRPDYTGWSFPLGREPAEADRIRFRWDLPNGCWGVFIDGECWAVWVRRATLRMKQARVHSQGGPYARPFTAEEVRFLCAKRRGQQPDTRGFVIEE